MYLVFRKKNQIFKSGALGSETFESNKKKIIIKCPHCNYNMKIPLMENRIKEKCSNCNNSFFIPSITISQTINMVSLGETIKFFN